MKKKQHTAKTETPKVSEPEMVYQTSRDVDKWNPNKPFHGTQEEWWEHFREIEKGEFTPVKDAHEKIEKWLEKQKEQMRKDAIRRLQDTVLEPTCYAV